RDAFQKAYSRLRPLDAAGRLPETNRQHLKMVEERAAFCAEEEAFRNLKFTPARDVADLMVGRAARFLRDGDVQSAEKCAERCMSLLDDQGEIRYNTACIYAKCAADAKTKNAAEHDRLATKSVELLRQAAQLGIQDKSQYEGDQDLAILRERADFKKFLTELK